MTNLQLSTHTINMKYTSDCQESDKQNNVKSVVLKFHRVNEHEMDC